MPEIYVIKAIPLNYVVLLFGTSPEGKYNTVNYQSRQRVSTMPQSTLRGQLEEYGHVLEEDDHKDVEDDHKDIDFRR